MALDGAQFVKAVMEKLKVSSASELAEAMRWPRGTERLVAKWLAGTNRPSYPYVMEMIDRAGLLNIAGPAAARPLTEDELAMAKRAHAELERLLRTLQETTAE